MALSSSYTQAYGKLEEFFSKIRDGQAPPLFTNQLLKDLGFKSNNHRPYIAIMKALGFLSSDGKPTQRYSDYRDHSKSKLVMGEGLKEAYSDIFLIKENPTQADKSTIEGKFKSYHNVSDTVAKHMTSTFFALLALADLNGQLAATSDGSEKQEEAAESEIQNPVAPQISHLGTGLHYNIQIHLPATKDVEVYNAIFKSLKEHLY
ncbi:DUF5343 domain-containing protein [Methylomonas lenta]|uniref:DUF5343 domain-containing protein n=1 Tax=Methylomonas lenta TaxID=980561 RepID=UPI0012F6692B|nr:DUF5343 domain-containing protein [Methylomonas lenta]